MIDWAQLCLPFENSFDTWKYKIYERINLQNLHLSSVSYLLSCKMPPFPQVPLRKSTSYQRLYPDFPSIVVLPVSDSVQEFGASQILVVRLCCRELAWSLLCKIQTRHTPHPACGKKSLAREKCFSRYFTLVVQCLRSLLFIKNLTFTFSLAEAIFSYHCKIFGRVHYRQFREYSLNYLHFEYIDWCH